MNLNVPPEYFNTVKESFLKLNEDSRLDPEIKDVVLRWQKSPLLDKIVPRWSCQSHDDKYRNSDYYIIFCTQDDGADILFDMFKRCIEMDEPERVPNWSCSVSLLTLNRGKAEPNIQIGRACMGDEDAIAKAKKIWLDLLQEIENKYE